jgi:predicted ester cyclase
VSTADENKALVRRLIDEVVNARDPAALDKLAAGEFAEVARGWIGPFRDAFPDFRMEIVELVTEGDKVAARFRCSGTDRGEWRGVEPTGRRFEDVDEIYIFEVRKGRLTSAFGLEDNLKRTRQLGIEI